MSGIAKRGDRAAAIVTVAVADGVFFEEFGGDRKVCSRLNGTGLLQRDKKEAARWYPTEKAKQLHGAATTLVAIADEAPAVIGPTRGNPDASGLVETVERARALLDDGDVVNARIVASVAYKQAKTAAEFAEQIGATEKLVAKARRMQADALLIEARAKILIADKWDEAQAAGKASTGGRPKTVSEGNGFTSQDTGLSRKEIHEARKLAAAEHSDPGIVERTIQARLTARLEPTRANLRAAVGTATASKEERGHNLYETPPEATYTLLALEEFGSKVKEPACGRGAIARLFEDSGYTVALSDLVDYGTADKFGEVQDVADFLESDGDQDGTDIVTNPPYGALLNRFVAHALHVHRPRKMALLLNLNFLCGFDDLDRNFAMDDNPPSRILVFTRRLPMMHRDGWDGNEASSRMNTAWFVWELNEYGIYAGEMRISRVDWKNYLPASAELEAA
ncbi:SAM-dependent methyltransferase [Rhizobium rhizogenes]|uniref:SAM-dependent methyltransferase n=1 Tax=Rhizobium rhizogenes TaxID=359 RepID=UPI003ECE4AD6